MSYDYLLYDNRTLGPGGYDWSVKAATGRLRDDQAVKQKFVEYCKHSFDTRLGTLSNFGAALGGVPLNGAGYLLCVTLESQDLHQRPSCAFVGIHCPQSSALKILLTQGDPVLSAKKISEGDSRNLQLAGEPLAANGVQAASDIRAGLYPFRQGSSPENVAKILLKHIEKRAKLPSILGIALWNVNRKQLLRRYEFAFCLGLPARAGAHLAESASAAKSGSGTSERMSVWPYPIAALCVAIVALIYLRPTISGPKLDNSPAIVTASPTEAPTPIATTTPAVDDEGKYPTQVTPEVFLQRFETLLRRIESASSQDLLKTRELTTLDSVPVTSEHNHEREIMITLLKTDLPRFQGAVKDENFGHYFQPDQMHTMNAVERAKAIREHMARVNLPTEGCTVLRSSFALWVSDPNRATGEWCSLVEDFSKETDASNSIP